MADRVVDAVLARIRRHRLHAPALIELTGDALTQKRRVPDRAAQLEEAADLRWHLPCGRVDGQGVLRRVMPTVLTAWQANDGWSAQPLSIPRPTLDRILATAPEES